MKPIGIAAVGDVLDINCWSNIPFYFYHAGNRAGIFTQPWSLEVNRFSTARKLWNLRQLALGRDAGGFQYSRSFLEQAEAQIPKDYFASTVITFNQLFPRAQRVVNAGGKIYYYIDSTLADLFREPAYKIHIPARMKRLALEQERENYYAADAVVSMGSWVHQSLRDDYQLPASRIHQILPGANIDLLPEYQPIPFLPGAGKQRQLVLGFIGKDWKRKGLPVILEIQDELTRLGHRVNVKVIGNCPDELKTRRNLTYTGFIDKQTQSALFIDAISSCDLGCLFSSSEALGISTLEFLRVGVPVIGYNHQGLRDTLMEGASMRFDTAIQSSKIAKQISDLIGNEKRFREMKMHAIALRNTVTWNDTIMKWKTLLNHD